MKEKFDILSAPMQPNEIEWRYGNAAKDGTKFSVLAYLTSRAVQTRFDEAFTPMGWQTSIQEITGGFLCTISVWDDDKKLWVSKVDGSQQSDIEGLKGGVSGSLKRCAVQWGVGRQLYDLPPTWIVEQGKFIPDWSKTRLDGMITAFNEGKPMPSVVVLKKP